jgi:hypothetical protein
MPSKNYSPASPVIWLSPDDPGMADEAGGNQAALHSPGGGPSGTKSTHFTILTGGPMVAKVLAALFAVTLVLVFSTVAFAQDTPALDQKKEEMKEMKKDAMTKMEEKGKSGLMTVACDPMCGFRVTSHDTEELTGIVKTHSRVHHKTEMTDAEVKAMMKPAGKMGMGDKMKEKMKMEGKEKEKEKEGEKPHDH